MFLAVSILSAGPGLSGASSANGAMARAEGVAPPASERSASSVADAEALAVITRQSIFLTDGQQVDGALVDTSAKIRAYLASRDFYSDYLSADDYDKFRRAQRPEYAGIGLELQKLPSGDVACFPVAGGPALKAGIRPGDRLLAIDGRSVRGMSLPTLVALAGGRAATSVRIGVAGADGRGRAVVVGRTRIVAPATRKERHDGMTVIRLPSFTQSTKGDLEFLVLEPGAKDPVVIDLRGNAGGDFHAAIDSAMLFLAHGDPIVSVRGRAGVMHYTSTLERQNVARPLVLWQDRSTASAAEVFIAALVENRRAVSIGTRSFGKGTRQDVVELAGGGAIILTTGYLQDPEGVEFDGKGLDPTVPVTAPGDTVDYVKKTRQSAGGTTQAPSSTRAPRAIVPSRGP